MKLKKVIGLVLTLTLLLSSIAPTMAFGDTDVNRNLITVGEDLSAAGTGSKVSSIVQNNSNTKNEQLKVQTNGSELTITGKTTIPPLKELDGYVPVIVTSFRKISTNTYSGPYIGMSPIKTTGYDNETVYTFSGSKAFSDVPDGQYRMYLWRGYKEKNREVYKMGSSLNAGILSYNITIQVNNGKVSILKYNNINNANNDAYKKIDEFSTENFLDMSLSEISFANKNPQHSGDKGSPLSKGEQEYIAKVTSDITKNDTTNYAKIKSIYKYIASNLYYDDRRPGNSGSNAAQSNPYENMRGIEEKLSNNYNMASGKVATNCVGYTSMVVAMARSQGIPARVVQGVHIGDGATTWSTVKNINEANHHWVECYVDGRWVMIDANMGSQNHYDKNTGKWTHTGLSNYTFFDPTKEQISENYLVKSFYIGKQVITDGPIYNLFGDYTQRRLFGNDRYTTSIRAADALKQANNIIKFDNLIVACGDNYADALAGSYLAKKKDAPILLVNEYNEAKIKNYIDKNISKNGTVYLLGGEGVVSKKFADSLSKYKVNRLGGSTRFETNMKILDEAGVANEDILLCSAYGFADSLSASAVGKPILLVDNKLSASQKSYLNKLSNRNYYLIGGTGAVTATIASEVKVYGTVERIAGDNRFATSAAVAKKFFSGECAAIALAYGGDFPDGLCGGPVAMAVNGPLLLVDDRNFALATAYSESSNASYSVTFGGETLISSNTVNKIMRLV